MPDYERSREEVELENRVLREITTLLRQPTPGGGSWIDGLPLWAKLLAVFGFPIFVALFFMAQSAGLLISVNATAVKLAEHAAQTATQTDRVIHDLEVNRQVQRQICRNTAKNPSQEVECDRL